jgi:hypothetical protein
MKLLDINVGHCKSRTFDNAPELLQCLAEEKDLHGQVQHTASADSQKRPELQASICV